MFGLVQQYQGPGLLFVGTGAILFAVGYLPKNDKDSKKLAELRKKHGKGIKLFGVITIVMGILSLLGVL